MVIKEAAALSYQVRKTENVKVILEQVYNTILLTVIE